MRTQPRAIHRSELTLGELKTLQPVVTYRHGERTLTLQTVIQHVGHGFCIDIGTSAVCNPYQSICPQ